MFLLQLMTELKEPVGEAFAEFVLGALPEAMTEAGDFISYYIDQLASNKRNADVVLEVADIILEHRPQEASARGVRVTALRELGREDEAIAAAVELYFELANERTDYRKIQSRDRVVNEFLPDHLDAFLAAFDDREAEEGPTLERTNARLDLIKRANEPETMLAALLAAREKHPDEKAIVDRLRTQYRRMGRTVAALDLLRSQLDTVEDDDDRKALSKELLSTWRSLDHPVKAVELRHELGEEDEPKPTNRAMGNTRVVSSGGAVVYYGGSTPQDDDAPTIQKVRDAIEAEELSEAKSVLRRLWRTFHEPGGNPFGIVFRSSPPVGNLNWPADDEDAETIDDEEKAKREAESRRRRRRGLASYTEETPEPEEPTNAWTVLADHEFGVDEMTRLLRSRSAAELNALQPVLEGLLAVRRAGEGDEALLARWIDDARAGRASRGDLIMLLALLEDNPEAVSAEARVMLEDLVRTIQAADARQLARVARLFARIGSTEESVRLYRWCATQVNAGGFVFSPFGYLQRVSARQLLDEVGETLDGADELAVVEAILLFADPGESYWGSREFYELLTIDTWGDLLEPPAALEKCRPIFADIDDYAKGVRMETAKRGAALFAQAGELDEAMRCFEIGVCRVDPADLPERFRYWGARRGSLRVADLRRLYPSTMGEWADPAAWITRSTGTLFEWVDEDRVRLQDVAQALALAALRLHEIGASDESKTLVQRLAARDGLSAAHRLWVLDVAREVGEDTLALDLERLLLEQHELPIVRLAEAVQDVAATNDAETALALGDELVGWTLDPELLAALDELAMTTGDEGRADGYAMLHAEAVAARAEMKALDEAARLRAEAEAEAKRNAKGASTAARPVRPARVRPARTRP